MPRITITERDLTSTGLSQVASNAVYIPGYAVMGPINEPTLCNTKDEFISIFGTLPYRFKEKQTFTGVTTAKTDFYKFEAGEYERSYIYAREVLERGLPVIYTRIFTQAEANWKASAVNGANVLTLTAKQVGAVGEAIYYKVEADAQNAIYTLTIGRDDADIGVPAVAAEIYKVVFDTSKVTSDTIYYADVQSNLVDLTWGNEPTALVATDKTALSLPGAATGDEFKVATIYDKAGVYADLERIADKAEYQVKFLTTGAYPSFKSEVTLATGKVDLSEALVAAAASRGDCVALVDAMPDPTQALTGDGSVVKALRDAPYNNGEYGAMFTPAGIYKCSTVSSNLVMLPSFGYVTAYGQSVQNNPSWLAVAGAVRGKVTNLVSNIGPRITSGIIDDYQQDDKVSINPITTVRPYGVLIWGNRTLLDNSKVVGNAVAGLTASSFLNIRSLLCDLKKVIYSTCKGLTFEQNSDILWINFKAGIVPTLDQMKTGGGLRDYEIKRTKADKKAQLKATIRLYAIEAVEDFDITIELADSEVTTTE